MTLHKVCATSHADGACPIRLSAESQLDAYKRGAFLEKTDRFPKENDSEFPGINCPYVCAVAALICYLKGLVPIIASS